MPLTFVSTSFTSSSCFSFSSSSFAIPYRALEKKFATSSIASFPFLMIVDCGNMSAGKIGRPKMLHRDFCFSCFCCCSASTGGFCGTTTNNRDWIVYGLANVFQHEAQSHINKTPNRTIHHAFISISALLKSSFGDAWKTTVFVCHALAQHFLRGGAPESQKPHFGQQINACLRFISL